jgi:hypothetical protein
MLLCSGSEDIVYIRDSPERMSDLSGSAIGDKKPPMSGKSTLNVYNKRKIKTDMSCPKKEITHPGCEGRGMKARARSPDTHPSG